MAILKVLYERSVEAPSVQGGKVIKQSVAVEARRWIDEKGRHNDVVIDVTSVIDGVAETYHHYQSGGAMDWEVIRDTIQVFEDAVAQHPALDGIVIV